MHCIFIFEKRAPFIKNEDVSQMWGEGFVNIRKLNADIIGDDGKKQTKAFVKGARLKLYPQGFHLYRTSRGIKKPTKTVMNNAKAEKLVADYVKIYENTLQISDDERDFSIITNKRIYNKNSIARTFLNLKGRIMKNPIMLTIKEAAKLVEGLAEYRIRQLCLSGGLITVKAGKKYLINKSILLEYIGEKAD